MRLLFALALVAGVARAESAAEIEQKALKFLAAGDALYKIEDFVGARAAFAKATELVPEKANPWRLLGVVDAQLGHCAEAVTDFDNFLAHVPPSDARVADVTARRDRCRDELRPKTGQLLVRSTPSGAEVRLDDEHTASVGATPVTVPAATAGAHIVYLHKEGFRDTGRSAQVTRGEATTIDVTLSPLPPSTARVEPVADPVPRTPPVEVQAPPVEEPPAPPPREPERHGSRAWIVGVVVGVVLVAAAVGVGVVYATRDTTPVWMVSP